MYRNYPAGAADDPRAPYNQPLDTTSTVMVTYDTYHFNELGEAVVTHHVDEEIEVDDYYLKSDGISYFERCDEITTQICQQVGLDSDDEEVELIDWRVA